MRPLSDILTERERVTANFKKAGLWCVGGLVITILSFFVSSHTGFSIITLSAFGWGGWNVCRCLKRLNELTKEEELYHVHTKELITPKSKAASFKTTCLKPDKKVTLRSKTFK